MAAAAVQGSGAPGRFPLRPLLALTGIFFLNFLARVVLAPLLPAIEADLGLTHAQSGSLFLFLSGAYCFGLLSSGLVSARWTHRTTVALSAAASGAALLVVSRAGTLWELRGALLLLGYTAGLYLPSGIATLTTVARSSQWGRAVAVHEMAPNLGFVVAPLLAEAVLARLPWTAAPLWLGVASLGVCAVFLRTSGGRVRGEAPSPQAFAGVVRTPSFWVLTVLFGLGIGASLGVYAILPLALTAEKGMARPAVNALVAASRVGGLLAALGAGWMADRVGPKRALQAVCAATGVLTVLLGVARGAWVPALVLLQPLLAVSFFPPGFAALARVSPPGPRNLAVSLTVPVAFLTGGGLVPAAIAAAGDAASFAWGIAAYGVVLLLASALVPTLRLWDEPEEPPGVV